MTYVSEMQPLSCLVSLMKNGTTAEQNQEGRGLPVTRIETISDGSIDLARVRFVELAKSDIEKWALQKGDILLSHINSVEHIGKSAIYFGTPDVLIHGMNLLLIRADVTQILPEYLHFILRTPHVRVQIRARCKRAINQASINQKELGAINIPVPSLGRQQQIVDTISRAEGIVRLQQQALDRAKALIPALFVELFGDPATNPKRWPLVRLGDLALRMSDGPFGSNLKSSHYTDEGVRVIRLQNIGVGYLNDEDQAFVSAEHFATLQKHRCIPDDVIIGTLGDPNLRAIILPSSIEEALNKADCVQFRCDLTKVLPGYICWLMNHPSTLGLAATMVQGITRSRISMGRLRELSVPCPALDVQQKFATRLAEAQSIITQQTAALAKSRELFDALLAQTFSIPSIE